MFSDEGTSMGEYEEAYGLGEEEEEDTTVTKLKLTYFRTTGKYYTDSEYKTDSNVWNARAEVRNMMKEGRLPGLIPGKHEFHVLVEDKYGRYLITRDML